MLSSSLSVIFLGAYSISLLGRKYPFHALILSVAVASLVAFLSVLVFCMLPPRFNSPMTTAAASNAAFYSTVVVFIAINGLPVLRFSIAEDKNVNKRAKNASQDANEFFGVIVLMIIGWGAFVGKGQQILVETFIQDNVLTRSSDQKNPAPIPNVGEPSDPPKSPISRALES
ncbi:MAG: hypothetical protein NTU79_03575 [Planctomycetota bacterium]|nr:hypothetical protein [Planctomycetota bacterium]